MKLIIKQRNLLRLCLVSCAICAASLSCTNDDSLAPPLLPDTPEDTTSIAPRTQVKIQSRAEAGIATPLQQNANEALQAGLYMVNYREGQPDVLLAANNYVNNQLLTWKSNGWTTETPIYWNDMDTWADFYAYAPYQPTVGDARQMAFSVQTDQRTAAAFTQSDLMWGTVQGQSPSDESFELILTHQLASLTVSVTADAGFDEDELKADDVSVTIGGTKTDCTVDLQTAALTLTGTAKDVVCMSNGDLSYTAILLPQQVPFANLIQVNWKGNKYTLQNSFTLESKRQYSLTVKLKKTKSGFDIGIEGWDILPEDFGGTVGG
jgi:hypothetical protein